MHLLTGCPSWSQLRSRQWLQKAKQLVPNVTDIQSYNAYFIDVDRLDEQAWHKLCDILTAQQVSQLADIASDFVLMPSQLHQNDLQIQLTQLVHDCGLLTVKHVIPLNYMRISSKTVLDTSDVKRLQSLFVDDDIMAVTDVLFAQSLLTEQLATPPEPEAEELNAILPSLWQVSWTINGEKQPETLRDLTAIYNEGRHKHLLWCESNWAVIPGVASDYVTMDHKTQTYSLQESTSAVSCHVRQFTMQSSVRPFDALSVGRGHKLKGLMSGYVMPDLFVPDFVQDWEQVNSVHERYTLVAQWSSALKRRARYWYRLGIPLIGGFLRTSSNTVPYVTTSYFGGINPEQAKAKYKGEVYCLESSSPNAVANVITACCEMKAHNPIQGTHSLGQYLLCYVQTSDGKRFERVLAREACRYQLLSPSELASLVQDEKVPESLYDLRVAEIVDSDTESPTYWGVDIQEAVIKVLHLPCVAAKSFIINHADHSVGARLIRDPMVGPWQLPIADVAVRTQGYLGERGIASAYGERQPVVAINPLAGLRLTVGEAITNIAAAAVNDIHDISLMPTWYETHPPASSALYDMLKSLLTDIVDILGVEIATNDIESYPKQDPADPSFLNVAIMAVAPICARRQTMLPRLRRTAGDTYLVLIDLANGRQRMGGSALSQVYRIDDSQVPDADLSVLPTFLATLQLLREQQLITAYHDRSDGGLLVTVLEMAFASRVGLSLYLDNLGSNPITSLFNEELGAVIQVPSDALDGVLDTLVSAGLTAHLLGQVTIEPTIVISHEDVPLVETDCLSLKREWLAFSRAMANYQGNEYLANAEYDWLCDADNTGLWARVPFTVDDADYIALQELPNRPRLALLRHSDSTGVNELAAVCTLAGFECHDLTLWDLQQGHIKLESFNMLVIGGGATYHNVLGAGYAWAQTILQDESIGRQFSDFFAREDTLTLGLGNGCQLLTHLRHIIPGSDHWPTFRKNASEQFECRELMVGVVESESVMLQGMAGAVLPAIVSHRFGRAVAPEAYAELSAPLHYVGETGEPTQNYPQNPNGSDHALAGIVNENGRVTGMMCHPERSFLSDQLSWFPSEWGKFSPWMQVFANARQWFV